MISRPQPDEYSVFPSRYINLVGNAPILEVLEYQQQSTCDLFTAVHPDKAAYAYAEGKWTIKQVLGHIIDTERVFAYRALVFSREQIELAGFDQDVYMANSSFESRSIIDLANEFKIIRQSTLYLFRSFTEAQLTQKGIASGNPVSVRALAYMIAGHEIHHINILKEKYFVD